jgi:hypothetical protein
MRADDNSNDDSNNQLEHLSNILQNNKASNQAGVQCANRVIFEYDPPFAKCSQAFQSELVVADLGTFRKWRVVFKNHSTCARPPASNPREHRIASVTRPRNPRFQDAHAGTKRSLKAKTINRDSGISGTECNPHACVLVNQSGKDFTKEPSIKPERAPHRECNHHACVLVNPSGKDFTKEPSIKPERAPHH